MTWQEFWKGTDYRVTGLAIGFIRKDNRNIALEEDRKPFEVD